MSERPSLVFVPGSWHKPACYEKIIKPLEEEHKLKCVPITLPSTADNASATFKDDIDAARTAITSETIQKQNVIVIAHSYGGMVANSAIKGLARPRGSAGTGQVESGYVIALVLIASGFTITGLAFMDPFFGIPPPSWRVDKETGYAVLVADPREFFYHDLPDDEAAYWVSQLMTQSLKALFEGGEHAYAGWQDVPATWYVGTTEDRGLPVVVQRIQVVVARSQGAVVYHTELKSSHSPFLSMPNEVVDVIMDAVEVSTHKTNSGVSHLKSNSKKELEVPMVRLSSPGTWLRFGLPFLIGRVIGWGITGFMALRRFWRGR